MYLKYLENSGYLLSVVSIMTLSSVITITFFSLRVDAKNTPRGGALNLGGWQPTLDKNEGTKHFVQEWGVTGKFDL